MRANGLRRPPAGPIPSSLTGKAVLAVGGPGLLASIFSLGLALPWAITRWRRMVAATTYFAGSIDAATLHSIQDSAATSTLEGVGEAAELRIELPVLELYELGDVCLPDVVRHGMAPRSGAPSAR